jgi:hypothetical protein
MVKEVKKSEPAEEAPKEDTRIKSDKEPAKQDSIVNISEDVESAQKPYPTGNPPDPEDEFERIHGFRRAP